MASANVIKEFLVALGFQVDQNGLRRFQIGVQSATSQVVELGTAMTAMAVAAEKSLEAVADRFTNLYYASERAQAVVGNLRGIVTGVSSLKAVEEAGQRIGLGVGGATAAVQALGTAMRSNPGVTAFINQQLGVQTAGRDTAKVLVDVVARLREISRAPGGFAIASRMAQSLFGISPDALLFMIDHLREFRQEIAAAEERQRRSGVDQGAAAERFREFNNRLADAVQEWRNLADIIGVRFLPIGLKIAAWAKDLAVYLEDLDKRTEGWSTSIGGLVVALGGLAAVLKVVRGLLGLLGFGAAAGGAAVGGGLVAMFMRRAIGALGLLFGAKWLYDEYYGEKKEHPEESGSQHIGRMFDRLKSWWKGNAPGWAGGARPKVPNAITGERRDAALKYFQEQGWTAPQAAGIVSNLNFESGLDPKAVNKTSGAYGLAQWLTPKRVADFRRLFGHDLKDSSFEEQLAFVQWELENTEREAAERIRRARTAREAGAAAVSYTRPGDQPTARATVGAGAESLMPGLRPPTTAGSPGPRADLSLDDLSRAGRGFTDATRPGAVSIASNDSIDRSVSVSQTNHVHVEGHDAPEASRAVVDGLSRLNGDLVRNLRSAVV